MLVIGHAALRARALAAAARDGTGVSLHEAAWVRIREGHAALRHATAEGGAIYGVSTGLGAAADTRVPAGSPELQRRVVLARMVGVGPPAAPGQVRAAMLARLAGLATGRSGASPGIVAAYVDMLNAGLVPVMPLTGSVGEADLAPLAHVAGVLAGAGAATLGGETLPGAQALARAGIAPPVFDLRDGLALVSSNAVSVGLGALVLADAERLLGAQLAAAVLSLEGFRANLAPLHPDSARLRPAPGQGEVAAALLALLAGGDLARPGGARRLQDPLSLRCLAPVLGAALSALRAATVAVELELATSDDNPAVLAERSGEDAVRPNANFDTTHLVLAFETLCLSLSRVAAAQGSRVLHLMSPGSSGLPRFLSPLQGGRTGMATVQKTVSALVAEIGQHAAPLPACALPAADGVEDVSTMAVSVMRRSAALLEAMRLLCAVELLAATQACDLLPAGTRLAPATAAAHAAVRERAAMLTEDRPSSPDIVALDALIGEGRFDPLAAALLDGGAR